MSVSLGFISYTISVLKSILPVDSESSAGNLPDEIPLMTGANTFPAQENQLNEIIAQATNKLLEKSDSGLDIVSAGLPPLATTENKADELTKTLNDSVAAAASEIKKLDQKPVEEYEDVLVTEYYLKYYYGQEDHIKFKQKVDTIEFKERTENETDIKQKFQKELLERERLDLQKGELEKINLKAIRDFQQRIISDKLKDSKKD